MKDERNLPNISMNTFTEGVTSITVEVILKTTIDAKRCGSVISFVSFISYSQWGAGVTFLQTQNIQFIHFGSQGIITYNFLFRYIHIYIYK